MSNSEALKSFHQGTAFGASSWVCVVAVAGSSNDSRFRRVKEDVGDSGGRVGDEGGNLTAPLIAKRLSQL